MIHGVVRKDTNTIENEFSKHRVLADSTLQVGVSESASVTLTQYYRLVGFKTTKFLQF